MSVDPSILVMGVGVTDENGIFGTTSEAHKRYPQQVLEMPLSENMTMGAAMGLALAGYHPVVVHARMDFLWLAMEHLANTLAKWGYTTGTYPGIVIRAIIGRGWGQGPTHSQNLYGTLSTIPGLRIYVPYRAVDAYYAIRHSLRTPGPIVVLEHRSLYSERGNIPTNPGSLYWGLGNVTCYGKSPFDHTLVGLGDALKECHLAAKYLSEEGLSVVVLDPQMYPFSDHFKSLLDSLPNILYCTNVPGYGDLHPPHTPVPSSPDLERHWYITVDDIVRHITRSQGVEVVGVPSNFRGPF